MTGGHNRPASVNLNAVKEYLSSPQVAGDTLQLARSLDSKTVTMVTAAKNQALQRIAARYPNAATNARQAAGKAAAEGAVITAFNVGVSLVAIVLACSDVHNL